MSDRKTGTDRDAVDPSATPRRANPLYVRLAVEIRSLILNGTLRLGERVPSLRQLKRQRRVSTSTALQAYAWLEDRGFIEARPRSGFYVRVPYVELSQEPSFTPSKPSQADVGWSKLLGEILASAFAPSKLSFAAACIDPSLLATQRLNQILSRTVRESPDHSATYSFPPGSPELRRQIALRSAEIACHLSPDDIVITSGACEAIHLCLQAVAKPGDAVAVESPSFFGIPLSIQSLGMRVIEIPTHPQSGMDLGALTQLLRKKQVRACVVSSNCQNPLGYVMAEKSKRDLAELAARYELPVIEDDVFGDLAFGDARPVTVKSFDRAGLVLLCSSYSKVVAPGFRVGWVAAGRFRSALVQLKFVSSLAAPSLPQSAMAEFLSSGGYDRYLRRLRTVLESNVSAYTRTVSESFPQETRVSRPRGGFILWIELPRRLNGLRVYRQALRREGIAVLPGSVFTSGSRFRNCLRLSCGREWSPSTDRALRKLGRLCSELMG